MKTTTSPRVERRTAGSWPYCVPQATEGPHGVAADSGNEPPADWWLAASTLGATVVYVGGDANEVAETERPWASLARSAQARWARENPF